jgi:hypothetical protein
MMNTEATGNTKANFVGTKMHCSSILMLVALLFSGCGEFAYKRGASLSDYETAKQACRARSSEPATVEQCMADNGWVVQNLARMAPTDADPVVDISVIPSNQRVENAVTATPEKQGAENAAPSAPAAPGSGKPSAAAHKPPDMRDTFKVSSWWKAGSNADNLQADIADCVAKLGEPHRPNNQTQEVTRGLLLCMKEKAWSGLRAK